MTKEQVEAWVDKESQLTEQLIISSLMGWNWVDDAGNSLPLPKGREDLDKLTMQEIYFIVQSIQGLSEKKAEK